MNDIQRRLLEILIWTDSFCRKNDIKYYLVGGSMLGAVRHKGFIPWDDDIDIALCREDYEKLYKALNNYGDAKYCVETYKNGKDDYIYPYMKIYDKSTTLVEKTRNKLKRGLFLDVFPLDGVGDCGKEPMRNLKAIRHLVNLLSLKVCKVNKNRKLYKNIALISAKIIPNFILNYKKLIIEIDSKCSKYNFDDSLYVGILCGKYGYREVMDKNFYGTPKEYDFEGFKFFGVENPDGYLEKLYGDYMKLPPPEKRTCPHDFIYCNLEEPFI